MLDDRNEETDAEQNARIRDVGLAESLFGKEFEISSHDKIVQNLELHFEQDRKKSAERFEAKKRRSEERKRKQIKAKQKLPKLQMKIRKYLLKKPDGVPSANLIAKFEPIMKKHCFSKEQFRSCLTKVATLREGVWSAR